MAYLWKVASCLLGDSLHPSLTWHLLSPVCPCSRLLRNCRIFLLASVFPEPLRPLQEGRAKAV